MRGSVERSLPSGERNKVRPFEVAPASLSHNLEKFARRYSLYIMYIKGTLCRLLHSPYLVAQKQKKMFVISKRHPTRAASPLATTERGDIGATARRSYG